MRQPTRRTHNWPLVADLAIKMLTVIILAWAVVNPDLPQFQGKGFAARAIVYPAALLIVPLGWWVFRPVGIRYPLAADILIGLPFLIDVIGNALDLYDTIAWWDDANHLVNWALHSAAIGLLLRYGDWSRGIRGALTFGYAVTSAVLWEFAEYVTFVPDSPEAVSAYGDTLLDLALGMIGGLAAAVVTSRLPTIRRGPGPPLRG